MLSDKFYEMWGLTLEGGEERTYAIDAEVRKLEAVVELVRIVTNIMWNISGDRATKEAVSELHDALADLEDGE